MSPARKIYGELILKEFQTILALEEEAARLYRQLAEDCDDALASEMLLRIARDETAHVAIAQELVKLAKRWVSP